MEEMKMKKKNTGSRFWRCVKNFMNYEQEEEKRVTAFVGDRRKRENEKQKFK